MVENTRTTKSPTPEIPDDVYLQYNWKIHLRFVPRTLCLLQVKMK